MSMTSRIRVLAIVSSVASAHPAMPTPVVASIQPSLHVRVVAMPRPVAEAVRQVEDFFGVPVTYEDTRYLHPDDIVDVTARVRRDGKTSDRILGMRSGSIDTSYSPPAGASVEAQVAEALGQILAQSRANGNTGDFRVDQVAGGFHVVPVAMRGRSGEMEPYTSALDVRITLPSVERTGQEALLAVTQAVTARSGVVVDIGLMPMNLLARTGVTIGAQHEVARDVLWRIMQAVRADLSWQLLCGAGDRATCTFSVLPVRK
jgi:hypothetical protein